jgi:paraquat-inducible protein B
MSKPANKTLIGMFVVGAIALTVLAVVLLGSGKFFKQTYPYVMYFEGSVQGLSIGAPVVFRGVKVATVTAIKMQIDAKDLIIRIPVYVEFGGEAKSEIVGAPEGFLEAFRHEGERAHHEFIETLIERGLRAQLETQSFVTGQLQIALDFHPDKPAKIVGGDPNTPEIPTVPTPLQEFAKKIQELPIDKIFKKIDSTLDGINRLVNAPEILQTLRSISQAAREAKDTINKLNAKIEPALSGIEATVKGSQKLIQNIDSQVQPVSSELQLAVKDTQKVLRNLDDKMTTLASRVDEGVKDAQELLRNIDGEVKPVSASLQKTLGSIEKTSDEAKVTLQKAQGTLTSLEGDLGEDSGLTYELNQTLRELRVAAKAIKDLADALDRQPESLLFGKKRSGRGTE